MRSEGPEVLEKIPENWRLLITQTDNQVQLVPITKDYEIGPQIPAELRHNPAYTC